MRLDQSNLRCQKIFNGEELKTYDYFQSHFFGMERPIKKVMRFLRSAALRGEESRQVLLLLGPVGAGKSALVEHTKKALRRECSAAGALLAAARPRPLTRRSAPHLK